MTDPTDRTDREDRAILAALEWLEGGDPVDGDAAPGTGASGPEAEADATLRRLSVETLGLLPWALEPETPSAGARERLLAALPAAPAAAGNPAASVRPIDSGRRPAAAPARRSWAGWLAAALVVAALGLAAVAGWLWLELGETRETLAAARGALTEAEADRGELAERLAAQEAQLRRRAGMEKFLAAASTAGVEICPLRPVGDPALHPEAFAVLYMPPGSGKWYLVASNLEPGDRGTYKVWLNTPDGPVFVGRLDAAEESTLEFQLPPDVDARHELMLSIVVTLEPEDGAETPAPAGPMVLFGDEVMRIS